VAIVVTCWVIPAVAMRMLVPSLEASAPRVENYRGRQVFLGLGIVWIFWIGGLVLLLIALGVEQTLVPAGESSAALMSSSSGGVQRVWISFALGGIVAIPAFVLGLIDDTFGAGGHKGFRGHLSALASGRLTTGGLKMLGIGIAALFAGLVIASDLDAGWLHAVGTALVIALGANFMNLMDLRPLRAIKIYVLDVAFVCVTIMLLFTDELATGAGVALAIFLVMVGPMAAVWRYDAREEGMLGDAGANPAGALVGAMVGLWWPTWAVLLVAAALLVLNALSEKISFTRVIKRIAPLRWLDGLGRASDV
jgi:hypothetical protein